MQTQSCHGKLYILTFIDGNTHYVKVKLLKSKAENCEALKILIEHAEVETGECLNYFCSDGGGEYKSKELASVRGRSFRPSSLMEYLRPMTLDTFHPCNTPYVPSHHQSNSLLLNRLCLDRLVWFQDGSIMGTRKHTPNISEPYSIICHCCSCHHCCAITIIIPSIVLSCI